jgi:fibro-slime domain-containing protein
MKNYKLFSFIFAATTLSTVSSLLISQPSLNQTIPQPESITLTKGIIRDFKAYRLKDKSLNSGGHMDFQRYQGLDGNFEIKEEYNLIVEDFLDANGKPVYKPGTSGSTITTTTKTNFDQWYRDVKGVNQSMNHSITLTDKNRDGIYTFAKDIQQNESFFPIDGMLFGNEGYEHNFHFTYELEAPFTYIPGTTEKPRIFTFKGDDDVYVFINGKKVIDIGGIHAQREQSVNLDRLGLVDGQTYDLKLFFAERNVVQSNFRIDTNVVFSQPVMYAD